MLRSCIVAAWIACVQLKRLQQELSEEAYSQLKEAMWALRKSEEQLTDEDKRRARAAYFCAFSLLENGL